MYCLTFCIHKPENIHKMKLPLIHSLITLCLFRKDRIKAWVFPFIYQFPKLFVASPASFKQARRPMRSFLKYFYHYEPVDLNIFNVFPCSCYYYQCSYCLLARKTSSNGLQCLSNFTPVIFAAATLEQVQPGPLSDSTRSSPEIYIKRIPAAPRDSISCSSSRRHLTGTPTRDAEPRLSSWALQLVHRLSEPQKRRERWNDCCYVYVI